MTSSLSDLSVNWTAGHLGCLAWLRNGWKILCWVKPIILAHPSLLMIFTTIVVKASLSSTSLFSIKLYYIQLGLVYFCWLLGLYEFYVSDTVVAVGWDSFLWSLRMASHGHKCVLCSDTFSSKVVRGLLVYCLPWGILLLARVAVEKVNFNICITNRGHEAVAY